MPGRREGASGTLDPDRFVERLMGSHHYGAIGCRVGKGQIAVTASIEPDIDIRPVIDGQPRFLRLSRISDSQRCAGRGHPVSDNLVRHRLISGDSGNAEEKGSEDEDHDSFHG